MTLGFGLFSDGRPVLIIWRYVFVLFVLELALLNESSGSQIEISCRKVDQTLLDVEYASRPRCLGVEGPNKYCLTSKQQIVSYARFLIKHRCYNYEGVHWQNEHDLFAEIEEARAGISDITGKPEPNSGNYGGGGFTGPVGQLPDGTVLCKYYDGSIAPC